ncbi:SDR family NAD(P)-dependent oxidoreductase [Eubacteriales bacterium OttesenSCG-928-A19]|nr:SDR family NAD(P)-dependent oxidoreductase [Eubacteriales bacterium OttesenSCG-928-A19]
MAKKWSAKEIPNLTGKTVLVTGGNSGIGYQTTLELAKAGATVVITSRDVAKGKAAIAKMKEKYPGAKVICEQLDLADLSSIRAFVERYKETIGSLNILINNAGVMNIPKRELTKDGFEMHMGTNHLGHFALTLGLLPLLRKSKGRVVAVSALVAYNGIMDFDNLQSEKTYKPMDAYAQSKLANVLFVNELSRREAKNGIISVAVQPGSALTGLQRYTPQMGGLIKVFMKIAGQSVENCALPSLYAATQPSVKSQMFFGPTGRFNKGGAGPAKMPEKANDVAMAKRLWDISETLTGSRWEAQ